jgi:hypothetical protein
MKTLEFLDSSARQFIEKFGTMFLPLSERFLACALGKASLFMRVNEALRLVPMPVVGHFMREFEGFQSHIEISDLEDQIMQGHNCSHGS